MCTGFLRAEPVKEFGTWISCAEVPLV